MKIENEIKCPVNYIPILEGYLSKTANLGLDCEQSLFLFRCSEGSARAPASTGEDARREKRGPRPSRAWSFSLDALRRRDCSQYRSLTLVLNASQSYSVTLNNAEVQRYPKG